MAQEISKVDRDERKMQEEEMEGYVQRRACPQSHVSRRPGGSSKLLNEGARKGSGWAMKIDHPLLKGLN